GCLGAGGLNQLGVVVLPWDGGTYRVRASGMPDHGFVFSVLGYGQLALPLPSLLPLGGAGCTLLVTPDRVELLPVQFGVAELAIRCDRLPSLIGQTVYHQVVPFELDLQQQVVAVTATNGIAVTVGGY